MIIYTGNVTKMNESLKTQIYNSILNGILSGEYLSGQILTEKGLVEKYGCSKAPVREALVALCNDGILRSFPRYGYEVVRLTSQLAQDIQNYRLILETGCLRQCFDHITRMQLRELTHIAERCMQPDADLWQHWETNTQFHLTLISFSQNNYAYEQLEKSMAILKRAYAQFYFGTWNQNVPVSDVQNHFPIIKSIEEKNLEQALKYLEDDLHDFCFY